MLSTADEEVHLGVGDYALAPGRPVSGVPCLMVADGAVCVRAAEGPWQGSPQVALLARLEQPSVEALPGDLVAVLIAPPGGKGRCRCEASALKAQPGCEAVGNPKPGLAGLELAPQHR